MKHILHLLGVFLILFSLSCSSTPQHTENINSLIQDNLSYAEKLVASLKYSPVCEGIEVARVKDKKLPIIISVAKVSLKNKNLKIVATEKECFKSFGFVFPETTLDFAKRQKTNLSINANFFLYKFFFLDRVYKTLGLCISDGILLSPCMSDFANLIFKKDGSVVISYEEITQEMADNIICAVSGFNKVIEKGAINIRGRSKRCDTRMLIGIDKMQETLFILSVGNQTLFNATVFLQLLGSYEGIELDGGGSSSLIIKQNNKYLQFSPLSKIQKRRVATNLGLIVEENHSNK